MHRDTGEIIQAAKLAIGERVVVVPRRETGAEHKRHVSRSPPQVGAVQAIRQGIPIPSVGHGGAAEVTSPRAGALALAEDVGAQRGPAGADADRHGIGAAQPSVPLARRPLEGGAAAGSVGGVVEAVPGGVGVVDDEVGVKSRGGDEQQQHQDSLLREEATQDSHQPSCRTRYAIMEYYRIIVTKREE